MKFFVMGDSWGVGEWEWKGKILHSVPDTGLDYHLLKLGHTVKNISAGSAGNFGQLRHAYYTLEENSDYDYIIWFYTEPIRDIQQILIDDPDEGQRFFPKFNINELDQSLHYILDEDHKYAQMIYDRFNIPFIIIGGQCSVDLLDRSLPFVYDKIEWLQELLELDFIPPLNSFGSWQKLEKIFEHYQFDMKQYVLTHEVELDNIKIIEDKAKLSDKFPDSGHPSRQCFEQLAHRLVDMLC
jgi:hypothetical protein